MTFVLNMVAGEFDRRGIAARFHLSHGHGCRLPYAGMLQCSLRYKNHEDRI